MELIIADDNPYGQNVYFYFDKETREGIIIDPGDCFDTIKKIIEENKIKITAILLTHGHFDHVFRANEVRELTNAPVYIHEEEAELLKTPELNRAGYRGLEISVIPDKLFKDEDFFEFSNGHKLKVIHTPGHTAGGVCYYDENAGLAFTGDTLFKGTVGRSDMPTGNEATLLKSIKEKLYTLPENTKIYPGHQESSSISHEMKYNRVISKKI